MFRMERPYHLLLPAYEVWDNMGQRYVFTRICYSVLSWAGRPPQTAEPYPPPRREDPLHKADPLSEDRAPPPPPPRYEQTAVSAHRTGMH